MSENTSKLSNNQTEQNFSSIPIHSVIKNDANPNNMTEELKQDINGINPSSENLRFELVSHHI